MRDAGQRAARRDARRRPVEARAQRRGSIARRARHCASAAGGVAERAGDPDVVADARAVAAQRAPGVTKPCTVTQIDSGPRVVSPPTSATPCCVGELEEAVEEARRARPRRPRGSDSDSVHHAGSAPIAARSERLTASAFQPMSAGAVSSGKCTPAIERVGGDDQCVAGRHLQQRGVVADAEHHVVARRRARARMRSIRSNSACAASAQRHAALSARGAATLLARGACTSAARHAAAAWSSTPLT